MAKEEDIGDDIEYLFISASETRFAGPIAWHVLLELATKSNVIATLICYLYDYINPQFLHNLGLQGVAKNGATGHPLSLQIFRKLHDRIA